MPDSSKAKARRRASAAKAEDAIKKIAEYADGVAEEAVNTALINIPKGYRKVAESDDMFTRTKVSAYFNGQSYYFYFKDDDVERSFGPAKKRNIQTLIDVLKDLLSSGTVHYIE